MSDRGSPANPGHPPAPVPGLAQVADGKGPLNAVDWPGFASRPKSDESQPRERPRATAPAAAITPTASIKSDDGSGTTPLPVMPVTKILAPFCW